MSHDELRDALGAYVLGALEPAERSEVAAHLETCESCRAEMAAIAPLPGLLGRLSAEEARETTTDPTPEGPLRGALAEIARRRRVRRWRSLAAAAALVIVAGVTAVAINAHGGGPDGTRFTASDATTHVTAVATLHGEAAGSTVVLTLTGVPSDARCRLVVIGRDGHREVAGSWRASYAGDVTVDGTTAMTPEQIARMQVVTFAGERLVTIPVGSSA